MASQIYDNHTLYIVTNGATAEQITNSIDNAISSYEEENNVDLECRFRVNLIEDRDGNSCGVAFVFLTNPAVYHMVLGYNPDGSARIEYIDDPQYDPSSIKTTESHKNSKSWIDDEDVCTKQTEIPKIPVKLPQLINISEFELTDEQFNEKCEELLAKGESIDDLSRFVTMHVRPAIAVPAEDKYVPHIIKCKNLPEWVTKEDLKAKFAPYASDSVSIQHRYVKGSRVEETFPFVNINRERVGFVVFDPKTYDAYFALFMMKKIRFSRTLEDGSIERVTTICGHSFRTDRDVMADLAQTRREPKKDFRREPPKVTVVINTEEPKSSKNKRKPRGPKNTIDKQQSTYVAKTSNPFNILKDA